MAGPLIATKLHIPARRSTTVARSRLTERLNAQGRLILIAAPAGFGKTSVLTEWSVSLRPGTHIAWLSLDDRDNVDDQFWTYVVTALDRAVPGVGAAALDVLASNPPSIEAVLATLVNDLDALGEDIVLVLDDFHSIESIAIQNGIAFLLENLPRNVRMVIASRVDPALPLARLRTRGDLVELRAADLRFTPSEASAYLRDVMGLVLADDAVTALGDRTEGWIAALQLAALSMQGRADPAAFIAGFAGDDRYVVDYLVEEVLHRQPDAVRTFLLETSILSRLNGDLCDAVTSATGGSATLEALERANLFLVPLDDHRDWYRYHHLFAEMLRARLTDEFPERVPQLHLRASDWFAREGSTVEAIGHAIHAKAFDLAADMIAAAMPGMQQRRQELTLVEWFEMLPAAVIRAHPGLSLGFAGVLLSSGRTDGVDGLLDDAESAADVPAEGLRAIRSGVALYRAARALAREDLGTADEQSAIAVELSREGRDIDRGSSTGLRGLVLWARGELADARESWAVSLDSLYLAGHTSDVLGGSLAMADIELARGRLAEAGGTYRRGLDLAAESATPLRGAADMYVGMCDILREQGDLAGARVQLALAEGLGEYAGLPQNRHRRRLAAARLLGSEGDHPAAIPLLDEAERLYTPDFFPDVRPIAAERARAYLRSGRAAEASEWIRRSGVMVDDELSYLREFEHVTLARILLADHSDAKRVADGIRLLDRLLEAAELGDRNGSVFELLLVKALADHRAGAPDAALDGFRRVVELVEPEGYVRMIADEGEPAARLLVALAKRDGWNPFIRRLHAAASRPESPRGVAQGLLDPLSDRELDVLRLLGSDLSGPQISRELVVSLNTLRSHTKSVYSKLGVTSRREAVRRAAELGLIVHQ